MKETDFKKMLKTAPSQIQSRVDHLAQIAYVKDATGMVINAYSPVFKNICVHNIHQAACKRGDTIRIKLARGGFNYFELVENITLNVEIQTFERDALDSRMLDSEIREFLHWRDAQLKNQKQH